MDVLFFAYAHSSRSPLPALQQEDDKVYSLLTPHALQQHYLIHRDAYTSRQKIREFLILYRDNIFLFSYSGHADGEKLLLDDESNRAGGLAHLLAQCPNIKAVILNGCSTYGQVQTLLDADIPLIIATSAPVNDESAKEFAIAFYQSLSLGDTVERAFEIGIGSAKLGKEIQVDRGLDLRKKSDDPKPSWGIYYKDAAVLSLQLPQKPQSAHPPDFIPNEKLVKALLEALEGYSEDLEFLAYQASKGKDISAAKKRMAILNCLPAPIAEHLRKLITPMRGTDEGFDQIGMPRLQQLVKTFTISTELMAFTMLAQLWEAKITHPDLYIPELPGSILKKFSHRPEKEIHDYDYLELIRSVRQIFDHPDNKDLVEYFVPELEEIKELPYKSDQFMAANFFLNTLRQRLKIGAISEAEAPSLCLRTEESLAELFSHLGFSAQYTLASINNIDIEKYRHTSDATFRHNIVRLIDLLGGLDQTDLVLDRYTDNRSILLIKEKDKKLNELNLSPFIIDKNAFEPDVSEVEVTNIHFFSHWDEKDGSYYFYRANKPDEPYLVANDQQLSVVKAQLDAFYNLFGPDNENPPS